MQRSEPDGIVISCDFCGVDWDEVRPMIEGHKGSVLCLACLTLALDGLVEADAAFDCTLCLQSQEAGTARWRHASPAVSEGLNAGAVVCRSCVRQAARGFHKDPDTEFQWDELARTEALRQAARES